MSDALIRNAEGGRVLTAFGSDTVLEPSANGAKVETGGAGSGNLKITTHGGDVVTMKVAEGEEIPYQIAVVWGTGTDITRLRLYFTRGNERTS